MRGIDPRQRRLVAVRIEHGSLVRIAMTSRPSLPMRQRSILSHERQFDRSPGVSDRADGRNFGRLQVTSAMHAPPAWIPSLGRPMNSKSVSSNRLTHMQRFLDVVERVGNKVPHPSIVFVILIVGIIVLSHVFFLLGTTVNYQVVDPLTHEIHDATTAVRSLITIEGRRFMLTSVIPNFLGFTAVGMVIVAMVGVGLAEETGLIRALIRKLVIVSPPATLTYILVFAGILSSIAADAGYLVLIPLAAVAYQSVGRHPVAGLAAAFAAVGGAFGVNMLIKPVDGVLTEITNDAIHLVNPTLSIDLAANLFFSIASVVVLTLVIALVSDRFVEPRLGVWQGPKVTDGGNELSGQEQRGLKF
jgi:aminobenzoyl-glutamate transport protein